MNAEDLKKLGLDDEEVIQKIIVLHGKDIEKNKTSLATAQAELDGVKKQLAEANTQIESFKGMDVEGVKKSADEWKAKAESSQAEAAAQIQSLKFDHALEGALTGAKAKNAKAVRALLDMNALKLNEADGSIVGLDEQIKKIMSESDYLFESETVTPKIVTGGQPKTVITDATVLAARKAAGLPIE